MMTRYNCVFAQASSLVMFLTLGVAHADVEVWLTKGSDQSSLLERQSDVDFVPGPGSVPSDYEITVEESTKFQQMDGFGASLTDSSAWLINELPTIKRWWLLRTLFSSNHGIRISYLRLPMGSSDFSLAPYTYDDMPIGQTDPALENFSIEHDKEYIIPVLKKAFRMNTQLKVMGSPWTAPAWMKDNESLFGGSLIDNPGVTETYSDYFVKFIQAYEQEGIPIHAVTLQNEPLNEDFNLPTMKMEWWDEVNLVVYDLVNDFEIAGIATKIIGYDHNWDEIDYPLDFLSDLKMNHNEQYRAISGTAFHCYKGDPAAQSIVHDLYPDKDIYFTECSGHYRDGEEPDGNFEENLVWEVKNLIGTVRNWAKTVILWNIALDEHGGPHLATACEGDDGMGRCRGLVTIHSQNNRTSYHVEYYALGHVSKFVDPGAYRIESNTFSDPIQTVAFQNPNGSKVLVLLNSGETEESIKVLWNNQHFFYTLDEGSVVTFKWN